jgi:S1-C subfamily serine protease
LLLRCGTKSATLNGKQVKVGGDIITAVNGQPVASIQKLKTALAQLTADQKLAITILRNSTEVQITIQSSQ